MDLSDSSGEVESDYTDNAIETCSSEPERLGYMVTLCTSCVYISEAEFN